jgi:hypothetical protein
MITLFAVLGKVTMKSLVYKRTYFCTVLESTYANEILNKNQSFQRLNIKKTDNCTVEMKVFQKKNCRSSFVSYLRH